ncbi:metal ABC transporter substrate-binding protein [Cognatishimia sp. F0-27]|uniref:metal ABC transporter substrate-binding protein n=1 Tax=Cognatishimia sp. F0-27 TaxID=2816855 RepID=UPI001D0C3062|nr:metal ABC transporter substrate-binding protein [Cognatishimia sp. F0-27]MCC1492486.1 zinc ABC transporter substrate-binding protein [Cognatishimia sp. F0-27]
MRLKICVAALLATLLLAARAVSAEEAPRVIAVNHPLQVMAERLLGDGANVDFPVPDGVDPSFWRPSIADISAIQAADLILLNGAGFASWTTQVSLPRSKLVNTTRGIEDTLIATETITHSHGDGGTHSHDGTASFTWLDPRLAQAQAQAVAAALKARGLGDASEIDARLAALSDDLAALDGLARDTLSGLSDTVFITTHPRYQYLARAYGLTIFSLEWDAGAAPDAAQLADLQALVDQSGARVLIWEAAPPDEARADVAKLGLQDVVFPPLAQPDGDLPFLQAFEAAVARLADAADRAGRG